MKLFRNLTWLGLSLLLVLPLSNLQAKPKRGDMDPEAMQEMMQLRGQKARLEAQEKLLRIKTALKLRDDQMGAWSDYENFMLKSTDERLAMMAKLHQRRMEKKAPPTSVQLAEDNIQRLEDKLANAKSRYKVFKALYNKLDEQQRQTVDRMAHKLVRDKAKDLRNKPTKPGKPGKDGMWDDDDDDDDIPGPGGL